MQVQVLLVGKLVVVPGVHPLVEQVHLDVRGGLRCIFVDGAACTLVPWCICFDLALGARSSKHLTAANPRGLVRLCEGYDHVEVKGYLQEGASDDFRVALDGHVAGQAVGAGEGNRFDSDGVVILDVGDVLTMGLIFAAESTRPHMNLLTHP